MPRFRSPSSPAPHECPACSRAFLLPTDTLPLKGDYAVELTCGNCRWSGVRILDERTVERLDVALDDMDAKLQAALEVFALVDELERADRFAEALRTDAILPEDF